MRLRYKRVTYHFGEDQTGQQSVERHYRELMDELFRQSQQRTLGHHASEWRPPADIHETPEAILVKLELAGVREDDLEVTLYEDALVVSGRRDDDMDHSGEICYHEAQIRYGPFRAEILLPGPVQRDAVDAHLEHGFLRVTLPKAAGWQSSHDAGTAPQVERARRTTQPLQAGGLPAGRAVPLTDGAPAALPRDAEPALAAGARWETKTRVAGETPHV
jgi:HSP20 family molecular chaperone IbpA